jgi:hypothetical protein
MKLAYAIGCLGCVLACTSSRPPPVSAPGPATPPTAAASGAAHSDTGAADEAAAQALVGAWAEYWSVHGGVDTQRYVFFADGRFVWIAPAAAAPSTSIRKTGRFALEHDGARSLLVLRVAAERFAACDERCAHHADGPQAVEHATPIVERYEIGECAPNLEAQALDQHYACRAFDGRAFWRSPKPEDAAGSALE